MAEKETDNLVFLLKTAKTEDELAALSASVEKQLAENPADNTLLHIRAKINVKLNNLGQAINDYKSILKTDPKDKTAALQVEQLKTILKYNNLDIYSNPNTNFDPWLD